MTMLDSQQVTDALPAYEVGGELGRGGWGVVLSGRHRQLEREVAIKQLPRAFAADPTVLTRFTAEARLLASLDHPHIVPVYDFVERDGLCLLVMEKLGGGTVWDRFTTAGLLPATACALVLATCAGLQAAHERGILHRDVKPENLMFSDMGTLKVTDFGIAKVVGGNDTMATRAGEVVGTPAYMAPEQGQGGALSPATDVYAVATMLYELLCGSLPFEEDGDALGLLFKHAYEQPAPLIDKAPFLPPALAEAVMAGLATDPADRSPSAEAFALGVAEACTAAWGPGWLESEGVPLMGAGRIVAATERQTGPVTPAAATPAPKTVTPTIIRPVTTTRAQAVGAADVAADQVVPVQSVLPKPAPPVVPVLAALAGTGVALLLAFTGLGSTAAPQSMGPRLYPAVHRIDLSKPIRVPVPTPADEARITLEVLHKPIVRVSAPVVGQSASIDASGRRFLISGRVSGEVELRRGNTVVARQGFQADMAQPWYQSVPGLAGLVVLLVAFAYGESFLRSLRAGRKAIAGRIGLVVCGALLGASFVDVAWTLGKKQPTTVGLIVTCLVAVAAGVAAGATATRIGRRRRYRPVSR